MLTADTLRELLDYDPETGIFRFKKRRGSRGAGKEAGSVQRKGYRVINVGRMYFAHRLAWFYVYGEWPKGDIDHVNRDPLDNRIANLREATPSQNNANRGLSPSNTSGFKGVCWHRQARRWQASVTVDGKVCYLGLFETPEEAHAAYVSEAVKRFGEFARAA